MSTILFSGLWKNWPLLTYHIQLTEIKTNKQTKKPKAHTRMAFSKAWESRVDLYFLIKNVGYFSLASPWRLYFTVALLFRSSQNGFFFLTFEVDGILNQKTVQWQHFFLLNIEINKIVCFFFFFVFVSLCCYLYCKANFSLSWVLSHRHSKQRQSRSLKEKK